MVSPARRVATDTLVLETYRDGATVRFRVAEPHKDGPRRSGKWVFALRLWLNHGQVQNATLFYAKADVLDCIQVC